jgi:hypothetical protein
MEANKATGKLVVVFSPEQSQTIAIRLPAAREEEAFVIDQQSNKH